MLNDGAAMRNKDTDREKIFLNRKLAFTSKSFFFFKFVSPQDVFPNKEKEREILSLAVRCGSEECEWADELRLKEV